MKITVDFATVTGKIRPVHGFNNASRETGYTDLLPDFKALHPPVVRLHDTCGFYGGAHYVDIPNIFPDFNADANDENAYDFTLTDCYLQSLHDAGIEIFYRLGVTIEHGPKKYHIHAPDDPEKWASVCEHIVRHYNNGWANGYEWNIKYWEIWNEPDGLDAHIEPNGPPMWIGTAEEYYRLYSLTANLIKKKHPEVLVGGYSSCYILGAFKDGKWLEGPTGYFTDFLQYISSGNTKAPLDFFTYHGYLGKNYLQKIEKEVSFIRKTLLQYGFERTVVINAEWNTNIDIGEKRPGRTLYYINMRNQYGASHAAAALYEMQRLHLDMAMFYDAQLWWEYGCLFHVPELSPTKTYYAFRQFSEFYALQNECAIERHEGIYSCAAVSADRQKGLVGISNVSENAVMLELYLNGLQGTRGELILTDAEHTYETMQYFNAAMPFRYTLQPYSFISVRIS